MPRFIPFIASLHCIRYKSIYCKSQLRQLIFFLIHDAEWNDSRGKRKKTKEKARETEGGEKRNERELPLLEK